MTITRDGHDYELTYAEKVQAYYEVQDYFDEQDCIDTIAGLTDEQVYARHGVTKEQFMAVADRMGHFMRSIINDYDDYWISARDTAIMSVIANVYHGGA